MSHSHASAVRQYHDHGYAVWHRVLDPALIREADQFVDWILARNPDTRPENLNSPLTRHEPFLIRLVADPRLLDLAAAFLGPDIALYGAHFLCKPPRDGMPVAWHQDGGYWPLEPMEALTLWVAITASTPANGCMRVIPGTHRLPMQARDENLAAQGDEMLTGMDQSIVNEANAVDLELQAGDVSAHDVTIVHGSEANRSDQWRKAVAIRYIAAGTRVLDQSEGSQFLLRGSAVPGINEYLPWPRFRSGQHMPFTGCETWNSNLTQTGT